VCPIIWVDSVRARSDQDVQQVCIRVPGGGGSGADVGVVDERRCDERQWRWEMAHLMREPGNTCSDWLESWLNCNATVPIPLALCLGRVKVCRQATLYGMPYDMRALAPWAAIAVDRGGVFLQSVSSVSVSVSVSVSSAAATPTGNADLCGSDVRRQPAPVCATPMESQTRLSIQ
jgi:hypothetical protein